MRRLDIVSVVVAAALLASGCTHGISLRMESEDLCIEAVPQTRVLHGLFSRVGSSVAYTGTLPEISLQIVEGQEGFDFMESKYVYRCKAGEGRKYWLYADTPTGTSGVDNFRLLEEVISGGWVCADTAYEPVYVLKVADIDRLIASRGSVSLTMGGLAGMLRERFRRPVILEYGQNENFPVLADRQLLRRETLEEVGGSVAEIGLSLAYDPSKKMRVVTFSSAL